MYVIARLNSDSESINTGMREVMRESLLVMKDLSVSNY